MRGSKRSAADMLRYRPKEDAELRVERFRCTCGALVEMGRDENYGCLCGTIWRFEGSKRVGLPPEENPDAFLVENPCADEEGS